MGKIIKFFVGFCVVWFLIYLLSLSVSKLDWYVCLITGPIYVIIVIAICLFLALLGYLFGYGGAGPVVSSKDHGPIHRERIHNIISYLGGIIILWSMFFLPVLSYNSIDNIQYNYWLFGLFRYNDSKSNFISTGIYTISGISSLCALLLLSIFINQYSYEDKPIIILILGISSILILIGFYIWQLYELTPMLRTVNFPNNRILLPSVGFYAIMMGGVLTLIGGINSYFFSSKKAPSTQSKEMLSKETLSKETVPEMPLVDLESRYCLNCGMKVKQSQTYCTNCGTQLDYDNF